MTGEKYIVASNDNMLQIAIRNILNPGGYYYLSTCKELFSLMRQIGTSAPDFVVIDTSFNAKDILQAIEAIEGDMSCAVILIGDNTALKVHDLLEKSKYLVVSPKPPTRELLLYSVEMALLNYRRVTALSIKLSEVTSNFETRKVIERAKGILMVKEQISEQEAYALMRKKSMDTRTSLRDVSETIIEEHQKKQRKIGFRKD